jgi:hypothetical protein
MKPNYWTWRPRPANYDPDTVEMDWQVPKSNISIRRIALRELDYVNWFLITPTGTTTSVDIPALIETLRHIKEWVSGDSREEE